MRNLTAILLLAFSLPAFPGNGSGIDGGGEREQVLLYAWQNLTDLTGPCLADADCFAGADGRKVLAAIDGAQVVERRNSLKFVEDKNSKDVFVTGPSVGSLVTINLAPLYQSSSTLSLSDAADLLLTALERHHADLATPAFAQTRAGLVRFWNSRIETADMRNLGHDEVSMMTIQHDLPVVLAGAGTGYVDISPLIEKQLTCAKPARLRDVDHAYWLEPLSAGGHGLTLGVYGRLRYECNSKSMIGNFKLVFPAGVKNGTASEFLKNPGAFALDVTLKPKLYLYDLHEGGAK